MPHSLFETTHSRPLPYRVRMRVALDDDRAGEAIEWRGYAYSLAEALMQASIFAVGVAICDDPNDKSRVRFESIEPDVECFLRDVLRVEGPTPCT